ncbi:MAG TPA: hypothetical protein VMW24_10835 [Sedimentisphaerales bacterium]|nr:hypothetical protein [Sedimentisphaerales bacterium]
MSKILTTTFSRMLLIVLVMPQDRGYAMSPEDYGCLWWADGNPYYHDYRALPADNIPDDYPGKKQVLCFHTGRYGMAIDTINLNRMNLGAFNALVPYEMGITEVDRAVFSLPESQLSLEVHANGRAYTCVGRQQPADHTLFPVRFVEYGRFFQHVSINGLILADREGHRLDADCRLEIASWPDRLNMICYVNGKTLTPDKIILRAGAKMSDNVLREQDESVVVLPLIEPGTGAALEDVTVAAGENTTIHVTHSDTVGAHVITIRDPTWSNQSGTYYPAEHLDRLDKWPITLRNDSAETRVFRLVFDTRPRNITGFTPMILDSKGRPTGIPVQISKNWHRGKTTLRYQGSWVHGSTVIRVPPRSVRSYQYAIAYARWGGVPAASHAQLSLIGWGHNMFWDECAIGSFGESICYEPGRTQRRSFITDVRPLMVLGKNGKEWGWTGNVGGGDFLVYFDGNGKYVPMIKTRGRYYSYGPNLTKVSYDEMSQDSAIKATYTVGLARTDDYVRVYQTIRYDVLKPVAFSRLAFCQMPSDYYNDMTYRKTAIGNVDGMTSEWSVRTGSWQYDRQSVPMPGRQPWVSLHDVLPDEKVTQAARGLIVRKWNAVLGSKTCSEPHLSTYMTEWHRNNFRVVAELSPPPGPKSLKPGDYVDTDIELVVLPSKAGIYYGSNESLIAALDRDANTWKMVHREAAGNDLTIQMKEGKLVRSYPVEVSVSGRQRAQFAVSGGVGYVPVTFTGLEDYRDPKLYRVLNEKMTAEDQSVNGNDFWQTDYDTVSGTWSITYNINLDSSVKPGKPVTFLFR